MGTQWNKAGSAPLAPRPKKTPRQGRSRHLVRSILQACQRILDEEGSDALTTNRIAEVAGVGIASVYQYFPNKDAVLTVVYEELLAQENAYMLEQHPAPTEHYAEDVLRFLVDRALNQRRQLLRLAPGFYRRYHREFQLAAHYGGKTPEENVAQALQATGQMYEGFGPLLRTQNSEAARFILTRGVGAIMDRAAEEQPALLDDPEFASALKDMVVRFLLATDADSTAPKPGADPPAPR